MSFDPQGFRSLSDYYQNMTGNTFFSLAENVSENCLWRKKVTEKLLEEISFSVALNQNVDVEIFFSQSLEPDKRQN